MDVNQIEQFSALADNWLEAKEMRDDAASQAFEDELHERIKMDEIEMIEGLDRATGEPSRVETNRLQTVLSSMWGNASARLD